jgi:hypothetical protein
METREVAGDLKEEDWRRNLQKLLHEEKKNKYKKEKGSNFFFIFFIHINNLASFVNHPEGFVVVMCSCAFYSSNQHESNEDRSLGTKANAVVTTSLCT